METGGGRATSERTADIKVVAITIGARADNGVCEGDRVRFRPSDLLAEAGGVLRLIGSAGECRLGAHPHVRLAQAMSTIGIGHTQVPIAPAFAVHRHDIDARGNGDLPTEIRQPLSEIETRGTS